MKFKVLLGVLLVALVITNGISEGTNADNEKKIRNVLEKYEQAMVSEDLETVTDLFVYPVEILGEYLETKEQAR